MNATPDFTARLKGKGDLTITITYRPDGSCGELTISAPRGRDLKSVEVRQQKYRELIDEGRSIVIQRASSIAQRLDTNLAKQYGALANYPKEPAEMILLHDELVAGFVDARPRRRGQQMRYPDDFFPTVAWVYDRAVRQHQKPGRAVAEWGSRNGHPKADKSAGNWIRRCRELGYLTSAPDERQAGGRLTQKGRRAFDRAKRNT